MGKSVSTDLRLRIVGAIASGKSCRAAAAQFEVAPSTAIRVKARYEATGSVAPAKQGRPKGSGKLGACRQAIIDKVKVQPDITMPALALLLEAEHGVSADPSNLSKLLCQEGFTYKKKRCWHRRKNVPTSWHSDGYGSQTASPSCAASLNGSSSSMRRA